MSLQTWQETLVTGQTAGPTLTAAAAASCIPTPARITLPNNWFQIGRQLKVHLAGIISCAVTTPGTCRFDLRLGPSGTIIAFDTGAINLNVVAKTNVPIEVEMLLTCRAIGSVTAANCIGSAKIVSEALVGAPLNTVGGNGVIMAPVGGLVVGTGFDSTAANIIDCFFTQTVATGSFTLQQYDVVAMN